MAHAQKPDFVFRRKGRVHLNRWGRQFTRLLAVEVCASVLVMLTPCSEVVGRVLATYSIRQFPLHFPSRASPCAIRIQKHCTIADRGFPFSELPYLLCISQVDLLREGLIRRKVSTVSSSDENRFGLDSPPSGLPYKKKKKKTRQCTYNVTMRRVRATIVAVEK
jgi:hypothetical protein